MICSRRACLKTSDARSNVLNLILSRKRAFRSCRFSGDGRGGQEERKERGWELAQPGKKERRKKEKEWAGRKTGCGGDCEQWRREESFGFWQKRRREEQVARVEKD